MTMMLMSDEPGAASDEGQRRPLATEGHAGGDVRGGSTKQVAFAVGEGAMAVRLVHERMQFG